MFDIQPGGPPIYQQIVHQVRAAISSGRLRAGEQLPSVRALAQSLAVNHNTVARAYRELEHERLVVSRHGAGVFVVDRSSPFLERERRQLLEQAVDRLLVEAQQLAFDTDDVVSVLRSRGGRRGRRRGRRRG